MSPRRNTLLQALTSNLRNVEVGYISVLSRACDKGKFPEIPEVLFSEPIRRPRFHDVTSCPGPEGLEAQIDWVKRGNHVIICPAFRLYTVLGKRVHRSSSTMHARHCNIDEWVAQLVACPESEVEQQNMRRKRKAEEGRIEECPLNGGEPVPQQRTDVFAWAGSSKVDSADEVLALCEQREPKLVIFEHLIPRYCGQFWGSRGECRGGGEPPWTNFECAVKGIGFPLEA